MISIPLPPHQLRRIFSPGRKCRINHRNQEPVGLAVAERRNQGFGLDMLEMLRAETGDKFPEGVTAFRPEMAVHGKYKQACPRCGGTVQRIKYASNETNYCPNCQTGGKLLADRAFSRLLREDWPGTQEELEMKMRVRK